MKPNIKAYALTFALWWGLGLFALTWWILLFDGPSQELPFLGRIYRGYTITPAGSFIGLMWGLVDGLIGGVVFAGLYNWLTGRAKKSPDRSLP